MERSHFDDMVVAMLAKFDADVSDLNFSVNKSLQVEHTGNLLEANVPPNLAFPYLSPYQTAMISFALIGNDERLFRALVRSGSCDFAYQLRDITRFRVNVFSSKKNLSVVLRKLKNYVPNLAEIKAPQLLTEITKEKNGLVLVTGATGTGKSTTLAAILQNMNEIYPIHIVTLEDPIEFTHINRKATFNQRELGADFDTFPNGLRAALRQAPKVILVGELRDRETLEIALTAAETGHLVLSTLHTVDAGQTINRIIGMFDKDHETQIRTRLADSLRWVVCQRLLKKIGGGRIAAHEIMGMNLRVNELISNGEDEFKNFSNVIESSEHLGWQTFESCLIKIYSQGLITEEEAMLNSTRKSLMRQKIDHIKNKKGEKTTELENLSIDLKYARKLQGQKE